MDDDQATSPFAEWLETAMRERHMSAADLARRLGVRDTQVSRWRRAQVRPSIGHLQRIAELFRVERATLEVLAGYTQPSPEQARRAEDMEAYARLERFQAEEWDEIMKVPLPLWDGCFKAMMGVVQAFQAAGERLRELAPDDPAWRTGTENQPEMRLHPSAQPQERQAEGAEHEPNG